MSQKLLVMGLYSTLCTVYKPGTHGFIQYIPMHVLRFPIHGILQSIFSSLKTVGTIFCEHLLLFSYVKNCNVIFVKSQNKATFIIQIHCVCDLYYLYPL